MSTSQPWNTVVTDLPGIGPKRADQLGAVGIRTVGDLLEYLPYRYLDASRIASISEVEVGELVTLHARVVSAQNIRTRSRVPLTKAVIVDSEGETLDLFFFRQPYVTQYLKPDREFAFTGTIGEYRGHKTLTNPKFESLDRETIHTGRIIPLYSQKEQLSTTWLRRILHETLQRFPNVQSDRLSLETLQQEQLLEINEAWKEAHFPSDAEAAARARRRLAFEELWNIFDHIDAAAARRRAQPTPAPLDVDRLQTFHQRFLEALPFPLTNSQSAAIQTLQQQLRASYPVQHVVQGEVGSGKTVVAAFALLALADQGFTALYLAPTSILAQQHAQVLQQLGDSLGIPVALNTSTHKLNPSQGDSFHAIVGTHALLHHGTNLQPALLVVDEEHRFGVQQRHHFDNLTSPPHHISMTATPIPRTLAHVWYGNQHVSFLQPIPGKERQTKTRVLPKSKFADHLQWLAQTILPQGGQAFIIAPLIEPSDAETFANVADATTTFARVQQDLPQARVALLTGQTPATEKTDILDRMAKQELDILVATPVIEVGIDIPQASVISLLSAERFGLAQLHQLRGRVGRAGQASWCFLIPTDPSGTARLKSLESLEDGAQLAELDMQQRGIGEFLGTRQTGWDGLKIADWLDLELIEQVKRVRNQTET